jgi:signal transduction histidine kinase
MKKRFLNLSSLLFGNAPQFDLEHRVFSATLFFVFCAGVVSMVESIYLKLSLSDILLTAGASLGSLVVYSGARRSKKWRVFVVPTFFFFGALLFICWLYEAGSLGGIGYYFFLLSGAAIVVFPQKFKLASLFLVFILIIPLVVVEYYHPELIAQYASRAQRYKDISFALILCLLINAIMTFFLFNEYQRERTEKNQLIDDITREKAKVEVAVIAKQRLLSMITHDISNALFVINNNLEELQELPPPPSATQCPAILTSMTAAAHTMREVIQSVRLLEANDAGRIEIAAQRVELRGMLESVGERFAAQLKEKNIQLTIELPQHAPVAIYVEPQIFCNHVLSNVLWNAIKFSYSESTITMRAEQVGHEVTIAIIDRGIGIPRHQIEQLFLPGTKVGRAGTNGEPSTGLGLAVVKSFIELFEGRIEIESRTRDDSAQGHGTTVRLFCRSGHALAALS